MTWPSWVCLAAMPFWLAALPASLRGRGDWLLWAGDVLYVISGAGYAMQHDWFAAGSVIAWTAFNHWRRGGGARRKAAKLLGAKAKAARDALARRVRESGTPRPVLRPVPQGAP